MTATEVNGVKVIDFEPAESPLSGTKYNRGQKVFFKTIFKLLLEDGTEVFGCGFEGCTYTAEVVGKVRSHKTKHVTKRAQYNSEQIKDLTLGEVIEMAQEAFSGNEQGSWKDRALKAEAELAELRAAARKFLA